MAQVSKRFLRKDVEERIFELFWNSFSSISTRERAAVFLNDLLSPVEKTMIAKRLTIAFLLTKGYNYQEINQLIKVSDTTICKINSQLLSSGKGYKAIINEIIKGEKWAKFWLDLDSFFSKVIPLTPGTNWKEVRRRQWEERRKEQKPF